MNQIPIVKIENRLFVIRSLRRLNLQLFLEGVRSLTGMADRPDNGSAIFKVNCQISEIRLTVTDWLNQAEPLKPSLLRSELQGLSTRVNKLLEAEDPNHYLARRGWAKLIHVLIEADHSLADLPVEEIGEPEPKPCIPQVLLPCELLYQAFYNLFPAERMLVAAGRREADEIRTSALFDVTGKGNGGYVRADPLALGRALIAMENSGSFLVAWFHSHPGKGAEATHPSTIDLGQYNDWMQHFSSELTCAILVQDGWIRFWGANFEKKAYQLQLIGKGIKQEKNHGDLYRFSF